MIRDRQEDMDALDPSQCLYRDPSAASWLARNQGRITENKVYDANSLRERLGHALLLPLLKVGKISDVPRHERFLFDKDGMPIEHLLSYCDCLELLCRLDKERLSSRSKMEYSPLHYAIHGGSVECVAYILGALAAQNPTLEEQWTKIVEQGAPIRSLKLACMAKSPKIVKMLIDYGAVVQERDYAKLVQLTLRNHDHESFQLLLPIYRRKSEKTKNLLVSAIKHHLFDAIPVLLDAGESLVKGSKSPLEYACRYGDTPETLNILRLLCSKGGAVEQIEGAEQAEGPAHWACQLGSYDILKLFCESGASITRLDKHNLTCGIRLLRSGKDSKAIIQCLSYLLTQGFALNEPQYPTVLSEAITCLKAKSFVEVIKWLIKHGADFSLPVDRTGKTTCLERLNRMMERDSFWKNELEEFIAKAISTQMS